ncbi:MAG: hypothetical protein MK135_16415, partial [Polyangiaceae bacterium]|nr:hypothetical protein [Polyangiaceae bacterium]
MTDNVEERALAELELSARAGEFLKYAVLHHDEDLDRPERRERAALMLAESPELSRVNIFTAAATGDINALKELLDDDPRRVHHQDAGRGWTPLLFVSGGRVFSDSSSDPVACLQLLLSRGANANDHFISFGSCRYTAMTVAIGEGEAGAEKTPPHPFAREICETLLGAGANPNDSQAIYNTSFLPSPTWLQLFLSRGLKQGQKCNWKGGEKESTVNFALGAAIARAHLDKVALLLKHGADPDAIDYYNKRPAYVNAMRQGNRRSIELLVQAGAKSTLEPQDELRIAVRDGDEKRAGELIKVNPELVDDVR